MGAVRQQLPSPARGDTERFAPEAAITEQKSVNPATASRFLMGCIIDWTGVLKAPQIAGAAAAKIW